MPTLEHPRYRSGELLGRGAQGVVLRVVDREQPLRPLVAKLSPATAAAGSFAQLEGEFALLARLRVPGLVRVHDFGRDAQGTPFLVEDFVEGEAPDAWVAGDLTRFLTLAASLAETLTALHEAGFVHGDVKPANVRVPRAGRAVLLDLGAAALARGARGRAEVFTPAFAAPELGAGAPASPATDLFALGATLACVATGAPPPLRARRAALREGAPWIPPSVAAVVEALLAPHPADRPADGAAVLAALGRLGPRAAWEGGGRFAHVREEEVARLLGAEGVVYVTGPSGAGKSHVVREVATRALLAGRPCRHIRFPADDPAIVPRLVAYLRGDALSAPWPAHASVLLVLDDLHAAPLEVVDALDLYRCTSHGSSLVVLATAREAPLGAEAVPLAGLDRGRFAALAGELGVPTAAVAALHAETGGLPGWAVASIGRVPLTHDAALARLRGLDARARDALSLVATLGGIVPERLLDPGECAEAFVAGLLERDREGIRLASPQLARALAVALASADVSERAAALALGAADLPASTLLAAGEAPSPPARRTELLARAAEHARREGARAVELAALYALAASAASRTSSRLARLERLTRDAGTARSHPQVLTWLEEGAVTDPTLAPLALRRRAEERARAGNHEVALGLADEALARARALSDAGEEAYALATKGAVRLFTADWVGADEAFDAARSLLAAHGAADPERVDREESARLEHNVGVVALYRGRLEVAIEAFERSLAIKRSLGDRAGSRACLLNLGLALGRAGRHDEAERALVDATSLAEALGQAAGRAWCLAARADLAVRRGRARDAEQLVAEARAIGDLVPGPVRADLVLLDAEIAILEGDGGGALASLAGLDGGLRSGDALVDARADVLEARGLLALLPPQRRAAARSAIRGLRRARGAGLVDQESDARTALRAARRARGVMTSPAIPKRPAAPEAPDVAGAAPDAADAAWAIVELLAREPDTASVVGKLAALVLAESRGERAIIASLDGGGAPVRAWGIDVDGLPLARAEERIDAESLASAQRRGALLYQPDIATPGGRGARIVVAGVRAAVVAEHRFAIQAFDHVTARVAGRWGALADVALRVLSGARPAEAPEAPEAPEAVAESSGAPKAAGPLTTAMPKRGATRVFPQILGQSAALRRALAQLDAAVDTDLPVVVLGETGTGKELFARALHDHGARRGKPFVAVNCAAITEALFEAELFGHARGAFTGADRARAGLLARADGGTLFLDEVGELPLARQATLLRALETRRYRAVGSDDERSFDVRIVAATNRDLDDAVAEGVFRRDLLYRLRVLSIMVPPLRERDGDVALLLGHFLAAAGAQAKASPAAKAALSSYPFPGNVRELLHVAQRLAAAGVKRIEVAHLPRSVRAAVAPGPGREDPDGARPSLDEERADGARPSLDQERAEVEAALVRTAGNISRAAVLLGLSRHGFKKRMLRLGLRSREGTP